MKKLFYIIFVFSFFVPLFAQDKMIQGKGYLTREEHIIKKKGGLELLPVSESVVFLQRSFDSFTSKYAVELSYTMALPEGFTDQDWGKVFDFLNNAENYSQINYYSYWRKDFCPLFTELEFDGETAEPVSFWSKPQIETASLFSGSVFNMGTTWFSLSTAMKENEIFILINNETAMKIIGVPILSPNGFRATALVSRSGEALSLYILAQTKVYFKSKLMNFDMGRSLLALCGGLETWIYNYLN